MQRFLEEARWGNQVSPAIPVLIRGMSSEDCFFEEQTDAESIGPQTVVTRIKSLVNLETEIYLTNLKTSTGGIFRVLWRNVRVEGGFHRVGLQLLEPDSDFRPTDFPPRARSRRQNRSLVGMPKLSQEDAFAPA